MYDDIFSFVIHLPVIFMGLEALCCGLSVHVLMTACMYASLPSTSGFMKVFVSTLMLVIDGKVIRPVNI